MRALAPPKLLRSLDRCYQEQPRDDAEAESRRDKRTAPPLEVLSNHGILRSHEASHAPGGFKYWTVLRMRADRKMGTGSMFGRSSF